MSGGTFTDALRSGPANAAPQEYPAYSDLSLYGAQDTGALMFRTRTGSPKWAALLPNATPPTLGVIGDSISAAVQNGSSFNAHRIKSTNRGPQFWLRSNLNQRINSLRTMLFATSGDTTADVISKLPATVASGCAIYWLLIGTNNAADIPNFPMSRTQADFNTIWDALLSTGAIVITSTVMPFSNAAQATRDYTHRLNDWLRAQRYVRPNLYIADNTLDYGNPLSTTNAPRSGYDLDGRHPNATGAPSVADSVVNILQQLLVPSPYAHPCSLVSDVFSANNPSGNILVNGLLDGTGGTKGSGGGTLTGNVANSWALDVVPNAGTVTGLTVVAAKTTSSDGRPMQNLTIGGTYTGNTVTPGLLDDATRVTFMQSVASPGTVFLPGDVVQLEAEYTLDVGSANISSVSADLTIVTGGQTCSLTDGSSYGTDSVKGLTRMGTLQTEPFTILAGTTTSIIAGIRVNLVTGATLVPAGVIHLQSLALRKIVP